MFRVRIKAGGMIEEFDVPSLPRRSKDGWEFTDKDGTFIFIPFQSLTFISWATAPEEYKSEYKG